MGTNFEGVNKRSIAMTDKAEINAANAAGNKTYDSNVQCPRHIDMMHRIRRYVGSTKCVECSRLNTRNRNRDSNMTEEQKLIDAQNKMIRSVMPTWKRPVIIDHIRHVRPNILASHF